MTSRRRVGSVRRLQSGRWEASVAVGRRADGKVRRRSKTFATEAEAESWAASTAVEMGRRPDLGAGITLSSLWRAYEADRRGRLANSTLDRYEGCMRRVLLPKMGSCDVSAITVPMVQSAIDGVAGRTEARHCKSALSSVLTWAVRRGWLAENPIRTASFAYPGDEGHEWEDESVWDDDPFAAIESGRDVWDARTVLRAMPLMEGLPLEPAWLAMVGAGLRLEEAFALRPIDVRRIEIEGREVTQLAVHHARNAQDGRHRTKTRKGVRIVAMLEPFGRRLWAISQGCGSDSEPICGVSLGNYGTRWRGYFVPVTSKHGMRSNVNRGRLAGIRYVPLSKMRNTHETLMQEAGVLDSVNAMLHGHSERVSYQHYQQADLTEAAVRASEYLRLVG